MVRGVRTRDFVFIVIVLMKLVVLELFDSLSYHQNCFPRAFCYVRSCLSVGYCRDE